MDKAEIANGVKKAVETLNSELQKAADAGLKIEVSSIDATTIDDKCSRILLSVEIFEKINYDKNV